MNLRLTEVFRFNIQKPKITKSADSHAGIHETGRLSAPLPATRELSPTQV